MYTEITREIKVTVEPIYLEEHSSPSENFYIWAYHVRIENHSKERICLRTRYWQITDAYGRAQEAIGQGVVGEQPILNPGQVYEYTSGTPLPTPSGIMMGRYQMENSSGERFEVTIPTFSLDSPYQPMCLN